MRCPNPCCKNGWITLAQPIFSVDAHSRPIITLTIQCLECLNGIASCCDGGGSAQPEMPREDGDG